MNDELPHTDSAALRVAEGWLELGSHAEAGEAIEDVSFASRNHRPCSYSAAASIGQRSNPSRFFKIPLGWQITIGHKCAVVTRTRILFKQRFRTQKSPKHFPEAP